MTGDIRDYARLGLVHHMLYADSCTEPRGHLQTLLEFLRRDDIEAFDFCVPYDEPYRSQAIDAVGSRKADKAYSLHLFPARKLSLGTLDSAEQGMIKLILRDQVRVAAASGATGFVFVSGADNVERRREAMDSFYEMCVWFCRLLAEYNMTALLEPFDRFVDKKYLYGSIDECVELVDKVGETCPNIALELDIAHLPLIGEDIRGSILRCGSRIKRVHLGNCVLRDKSSRWYGDMHPPVGIDGGEIGVDELKIALTTLGEIGYIGSERNPLILEMRPYDGMSVAETCEHSLALLDRAFSEI